MRLISVTSLSGVATLHPWQHASLSCTSIADIRACFCRDVHFRTKFHASIVSIRRKGHKLDSKLGDVPLQANDEILFDCGDDFDEASGIVQQNLCDIDVVESDSEREFMVAFEVLGALPSAQVAAASCVVPTENTASCRRYQRTATVIP